jgi:FkbM family methyltransferase
MTGLADSGSRWFQLPSFGRFKNQLTQIPSGLYAISRIPAVEGRSAVFWAYLGILARLALSGVFPASEPRKARVRGAELRVLDYSSFSSLFMEIFVRREYQFTFDSPAPLILDCGSNIGVSVLYFKTTYPGARIVAFEPDETAFRTLEENVRANRWDLVELHHAALHSQDGEIDCFSAPALPGSLVMSSLPQRVSGAEGKVTARQTVQSLRLSPFVTEPVDLVKMDIEGAECDVMEDLARTGKLPLIKQIVLEYHHHLNAGENQMARLLALLEENGFGYQIYAPYSRPFGRRHFQDILLYAYRPA